MDFALSEEARALLQEVALEHEISSAEAHQSRRDEEFEQLAEAGMGVVELEGEAAANYLRGAREATWNRMRELMAAQPLDETHYDRLIELFYDFERAGG